MRVIGSEGRGKVGAAVFLAGVGIGVDVVAGAGLDVGASVGAAVR